MTASGPEVRFFTEVCPEFVDLTALLDQELRHLNGPLQAVYAPYNQLDKIRHVAVAYDGGRPVGCAAMKTHGNDAFEVKRVYVCPEFRKNGMARALMERLESEARALGARRFVLETGDVLVAAQKLYASLGFQRIPNYGPYRDLPASVCLEKVFDPPKA
jgi:GNAT superfamily N-acetyltransferase